MKKIVFSFFALTLLTSISYASCNLNEQNCTKNPPCEIKKDCINVEQKLDNCDKCAVDDDEYCIYNECYFDKRYKRLKTLTRPTKQQECRMDSIYKKFRADMELIHSRYRHQKNKVLEMIVCNNECYKNEAKELKEIQKEAKERLKCFRNDIKEQLCKDQYKGFRKFQRQEKRRMRKIVKYGKIYKLPCNECCK